MAVLYRSYRWPGECKGRLNWASGSDPLTAGAYVCDDSIKRIWPMSNGWGMSQSGLVKALLASMQGRSG